MTRLMLESWWVRTLVNLITFISIPLLVYGTYYLDQHWDVIGDMRITQQVEDGDGVVLYGVFEKQRECRFIEASAVSGDGSVSPIRFIDRKPSAPTISRPLGEQRFGPWRIDIKRGERATLYAKHVCHFAWEHGEMLTTFIVGRDAPK